MNVSTLPQNLDFNANFYRYFLLHPNIARIAQYGFNRYLQSPVWKRLGRGSLLVAPSCKLKTKSYRVLK